MKRSLLIVLLGLFAICGIKAQSITVTGKVTDGANGDVLPGVTVAVQGTATGTITDIDGKFSINVDSNASLVVSFIGFAAQEIPVQGRKTIDVVLQPDLISLEEVVAVGYGVVKKRDVTGSVASVSSEKLLAAPITSLDAGMQGKVAGVQVQNTTGAPGQKMKIRIRGGNSINYSNEPLYVIDGFIGADITTINPSDIATIDILKDASATAVYGSRGANGVVLITTNSPKEGKMQITYDGNIGVSNMVNEYDLLPSWEMAELMNLQDEASGSPHSFGAADIQSFKDKGDTDWMDLISQQGVKQNHTVNVNGGSDKLQYYFSANLLDEEGVIKNSFYKRASIRSNISGELTKWIDFKFNTYGVHVSSQANGRHLNVIKSAVEYPQFWPAYDANGDYIDPSTLSDLEFGRYQAGNSATPVMAIRQNQETFSESLTSNLDLTFKFTPHISLTVSNSGRFNTGFSGERDLEDFVNFNRSTLGAKQNYNRGTSWIHTDILTYDNTFGKHGLKASIVYEFSKSMWRSNQVNVTELSTLGNEWDVLQNGVPNLASSALGESYMRSYMARVNYSFADKYLVTASVRRDGAGVFQEDNRWSSFPSAALAWRASEEPFIQNLGWIHNLKVRAGFGVTGNTAIGTYDTQATLGDDFRYIYWVPEGETRSVIGAIPGNLTDPNIVWEQTAQYNAGFDLALMQGKLSAVFDVYKKHSTDVIIDRTIPAYTGVPGQSFTSNFAEIDNSGFELALNYVIMDRGDLSWDANFNISRNKNEVKSLNVANTNQIFVSGEDALNIWMGGTNNKFVVQEGESMGSLFGLKALGIWQENEAELAATYGSKPGEVKYEDVLTVDTNGDGIPDEADGQINDSDRQIIGQTAPDFTYGFGTSLAYKGFDLAVQCVGAVGNEIYNYSKVILDREMLNPDYRERWSPSNIGSSQQIMPVGTDYSRSFVTSQYIEDGSFFKISNIALGYTIPKFVCEKLHIGKIRLYVAADNILTITNYSGLDPEASSTSLSSDSQAGVDAFSYPLVRTITGGLKVTF